MTSQEKQQYWSQLCEKQSQSGLTITDFCKANQINISTYYSWRQKLTDTLSPPRVHPVVVQGTHHSSAFGVVRLLLPTGLLVELPADLPSQHIQRWVNALLC